MPLASYFIHSFIHSLTLSFFCPTQLTFLLQFFPSTAGNKKNTNNKKKLFPIETFAAPSVHHAMPTTRKRHFTKCTKFYCNCSEHFNSHLFQFIY